VRGGLHQGPGSALTVAIDWTINVVGLAVVAATLRDIFHTLWHPSGFGRIARTVLAVSWKGRSHVLPRGSRDLAGPLGLMGVVLVWTGLVVVGFVLVYWPHMPEGFNYGSSVNPEQSSGPLAALYLSLVTVATLGFGDILPASPALRVLAPVQALVGFVLLTAAISWVLQVYPALGRRRAFARRLSAMRSQESSDVVRTGEAGVATRMLDSVAEGVSQVESDLLQYAESYYFSEQDRALSLAAALPYTLELVGAGEQSEAKEVRVAARVLAEVVTALADRLDHTYLHTGGTTDQVLAAFAADHDHTPSRGAER
jgi:Ion channel